jgi:putative ABC transport system permease protein
METLTQDLRFALRVLWKDRGFTATTLLTLALCIAANAAVFTVVRSVLLRPLAVPEPDRLVTIFDTYPNAGVERAGGAVPLYDDLKAQANAFESLALYQTAGRTVGGEGSPERLTGMEVTPSFFRVLRVQPALGRGFTDEEESAGKADRVILSHGLWQRMFQARSDIVGQSLRLNGVPFQIVGVMPAGFQFLDPDVAFWTPPGFDSDDHNPQQRHSHSYALFGRLAPGATVALAQQQVEAVNARELEAMPALKPVLANAGFATFVVPFQQDLVRTVRAVLYLLWGGALFVLLIGAVNVTNLVLVRSSVRLKELATRHILGAGRGRIARQLVTETVLLTLVGGALGLVLGYWALGFVEALGLQHLPRGGEIRMDAAVVAFSLTLAAAVGVVVGLAPVVAVSRANLSTAVREEGRTGTAGRGARLTRRVLVTVQVSIACILLIGAGLLLASFERILAVSPGFTVRGIITGTVNFLRSQYGDDVKRRSLVDRSLQAIRAIPGVTAAGLTSSIPFGDNFNDSVIIAEGYVMAPGESLISPGQVIVSPGYLEALDVPLERGRFFDARDTADAPAVAIVDDRLAKKFWPDQDPIGRRLYFPTDMNDLTAVGPKTRFFTVVGVVGSIKDRGLVDADDRVGTYYFPYDQATRSTVTFAIRTAGDPEAILPAVRRALAGVDPQLPLYDVKTMAERVEESLQQRRTPMMLAVAFGVVALFLSAIGIYGVLAYQVAQRTRELGLRLALGSSRARVFQLILHEGLVIVGIGLLVGLAGVVALKRVLQAQLFGVGALDPTVLLLVLLLLGIVALVACLVPARRATRIDPIVALSIQ